MREKAQILNTPELNAGKGLHVKSKS